MLLKVEGHSFFFKILKSESSKTAWLAHDMAVNDTKNSLAVKGF